MEPANGEIRDQHQAKFEACEELLVFALGKFEPWAGRAIGSGTADLIVVAEAGRATQSYRAGLLLASAGFGPQAMMLGRSLFEGTLVAHWASENQDEAIELLKKHFRHTDLTWADKQRALSDEGGSELPEGASEEEREEFKALFTKWGGGPWTRLNNHDLRKAVEHQWEDEGEDLRITSELALWEANQLLHSTAYSLMQAVDFDGEKLDPKLDPDAEYVERALLLLLWAYGQTVSLAMDHFDMREDRAALTELLERGVATFSRLTEEVGRETEPPG